MITKDDECSGVFYCCEGHYSDDWPNGNKTCGLDNSIEWISTSDCCLFAGSCGENPCFWNILAEVFKGKRASCLQSILKWFREVKMHVDRHNYTMYRREREIGEEERGKKKEDKS